MSTEARFVVRCPRDGHFLIEWCTLPDGQLSGTTQGKGETWREEHIGYTGTSDERRHLSGLPLRFSDIEPDPGDTAHFKYVLECPVCQTSIELRDDTVGRVVLPILRGLHAQGGGTWYEDDLPALLRRVTAR